VRGGSSTPLDHSSGGGLRRGSDGDWDGWIAFFLQAVCEQADENGRRALGIISLYNEMKQVVPEITRL